MAEGNIRPLRVLHVVSTAGVSGTTQQALFMPLLTRMPKHRVKTQVVSLAPGFTAGAVLRQNGIPVHDVALSRKRFSLGALGELMKVAEQFRPDVIQAWGHTAQLVSLAVSSRCEWEPKVVWSAGETAPLPKDAGFIDNQKLKWLAKRSAKPERIVYTSEASAVLHRRAGFPDGGHVVVPPGVDPIRFKPDFAARKKVREQLGLGGEAFVIGMAAPFLPVHDHATLIKAVGELVKTNPHIALLLAGHGVQKGNGALMALVGGGTMGTRTHLLGEWSDMSSFFNACDVACSSSQTDNGRMTLVMAMLCGVPCVGTGMGGQGEVIGQFGVAVEPGSPAAFIRGITRIMQMPADKRAFMAQGARKHALNNFVPVRSMQKYLQMYFDIVGRNALAAEDVPTQEIDAAIPAPPSDMQIIAKVSSKSKTVDNVSMTDLSDPDSIESKVQASSVSYKKYKADPAPEPEVVAAPPPREGDVLEIFESDQANSKASTQSAMTERARGVADDMEDLLTPEEYQTGDKLPALAPVKTPEMAAAPVPAPKESKPAVAATVAAVTAAPQVAAPPAESKPARMPIETKSVAPIAPAVVQPVESPRPAAIESNPVESSVAADEIELKLMETGIIFAQVIEPAAPVVESKPVTAVAASPAPAPLAAPVQSPAAVPAMDSAPTEPDTMNLELKFGEAPPAALPLEAPSTPAAEETFQLELLADPPPPEELKKAASQ